MAVKFPVTLAHIATGEHAGLVIILQIKLYFTYYQWSASHNGTTQLLAISIFPY